MKILRSIFIGITVPLGIIAFFIWIAGHHGHFVFFRPDMLEDWIIWGAMLLGLTGITVLTKLIRKRSSSPTEMTIDNIIERSFFMWTCKEIYFQGIRPCSSGVEHHKLVLRLKEIVTIYQKEDKLEDFKGHFQESQYCVNLWAAHLLIDLDNIDQKTKNLCLEEIKSYSTTPLDPELAKQEMEWLKSKNWC